MSLSIKIVLYKISSNYDWSEEDDENYEDTGDNTEGQYGD